MTVPPLSNRELEQALNDFHAETRQAALQTLIRRAPAPVAPRGVANMHCHTFYSYNAYGYSPSGLAWLAYREGIGLLGIVDFDVLDGVTEFLSACDLVGVRGSAGIETRVFLPEFASREINSPGEPGVYYHMGIGFATTAVPPAAQTIVRELRKQAERRNRSLIERVNRYLAPVEIDYATEVLPLTPAGNATERHIVVAYLRAAEREVDDPAAFWADRLDLDVESVGLLMEDSPTLQNVVRGRLMKRGGPGYVQPGPDTFPHVEKLHELTLLCDALPCATWLDGLSAGEQAMDELLDLLVGKGVVALNIVPDRNWNIADPDLRARKQQELYAVVNLAKAYALPLNVGTEMNSFGQKIVDDFDAPALAPVRDAFLDGAYFIYGHTALQRKAGLGFQSEWARAHFPERRARNAFFSEVGRLLRPGPAGIRQLDPISTVLTPDQVMAALA